MRHKNYLLTILLALLCASTAVAQCPGPAVRTALINLQRAAANPTLYTTDGARAGQVGVTDTCGNQRYTYFPRILDTCLTTNPFGPVIGNPVSAFAYICGTDSLFYFDWKRSPIFVSAGGSAADSLNWYNSNDTTTNPLRTAFVLRSAWWRGLDSTGFVRHTIRPDNFNGSQSTVFQDSIILEYTRSIEDVVLKNLIEVSDTGIILATSNGIKRSVIIKTDTVNYDVGANTNLQIQDYLAPNTYLHADSLKIIGLGQFPGFPSLVGDGTDKGFFYQMDGVGLTNGDGNGGIRGYVQISPYGEVSLSAFPYSPDLSQSQLTVSNSGSPAQAVVQSIVNDPTGPFGPITSVSKSGNGQSFFAVYSTESDTNKAIRMGIGAVNYLFDGTQKRSWAIQTTTNSDINPFSWAQIWLPNDTIENAISFYNRAYYWKNEHPTGAAGDTLFHFWAATGPGGEAGKDPGFMTLDQIRGAGGVNWYNSNGTTTDNTRIATVTETATWLSSDVQADGVFPFRFELAGESPNEPENTVWVFPSDSATLYQSDQELTLFSSNHWLMKANGYGGVQSDSFFYNPNLGGTAFKVGANNVVTQNAITGTPTHRDAIEYNTITGTAQTELFLDGSSAVWVVPSNAAENFKIQVTAICSNAGNGVGISTGEVWTSWHVGGIKRISNTTSMVGSTQTIATAQADAGMASSVVTIDADDTDDSLRIRFTPPTTAGTTTVIRATASIELIQTSY